MLPKDPFILLSFINTKLRDEFHDLDELCASLNVDKDNLVKQLESVGFQYNSSANQFR